jgi:hypothetical protein
MSSFWCGQLRRRHFDGRQFGSQHYVVANNFQQLQMCRSTTWALAKYLTSINLVFFRGPGGGDPGPKGDKGDRGDKGEAAPMPVGPVSEWSFQLPLELDTYVFFNVKNRCNQNLCGDWFGKIMTTKMKPFLFLTMASGIAVVLASADRLHR